VLLHAGCMFGTYTSQEVRDAIAEEAPRQPVARLMPGTRPGDARIIGLKGTGSIFNDSPLLDENWLNGRMTEAEYVQAISSINEAVGQSMVGLPMMSSSDEIPEREGRKAAAATARVAALNDIWQNRGVRFRFQQGQEHGSRVDRRTTERHTDTFVFLRVE
jgi:hypothetical protein